MDLEKLKERLEKEIASGELSDQEAREIYREEQAWQEQKQSEERGQ